MQRFVKSDAGFTATLGLVMMPAMILMTVVLVDVGRGNNAHSDLQAAADAMALAGARELDGGTDAITRAQAAMSNIDNSVSYLGQTSTTSNIALELGGANNAYTVVYLTDIPPSDDDPIDATWLTSHATTDGTEADYVYVRAQSQNLLTTGNLLSATPVAAQAVATYNNAACNVTPLFICNPFESETTDLQQAFADGALYGRLIQLHPKGSDTASPGNFGFLQVFDETGKSSASADAIRDVFAGAFNNTCYNVKRVTTKPGAATGIGQGINVRMDIYDGQYSHTAGDYPPDVNVRKGYVASSPGSGNECNTDLNTGFAWAQNFPNNTYRAAPGDGAAGAYVGTSDEWAIDTYWQTNYQTTPPVALRSFAAYPGGALPAGVTPSRYDVYRYENSTIGTADDLVAHHSVGENPAATDNNEEVGSPICALSKAHPPTPVAGRRTIYAAIIDCNAEADNGRDEMRVNSYASLFLTRPMDTTPGNVTADDENDGTIDVEITDITGWGGNGTLDTFVRDEAMLVR